jgi:hypothetical protein
MENLTPGAQEFSRRIEQAFLRFEKRLTEAAKPKAEWNLFNAAEQRRLLEEQRQMAIQTNRQELEELKIHLDELLHRLRQDVEKKLRPLQTSNAQADRLEGQNFEAQAQRVVLALSPIGIEKEYSSAVAMARTDYATELIHWAELYADPKDLKEANFVRRLREMHEAATGVAELKRSMALLESRFDQLKRGNPFSKFAFNISEQIILLKNDPDFAAHLKDAAEKIHNETGLTR